jgi:hypothetical protein
MGISGKKDNSIGHWQLPRNTYHSRERYRLTRVHGPGHAIRVTGKKVEFAQIGL